MKSGLPSIRSSERAWAAVGLVVIGRNEGERLRRCLDSLSGSGRPVVYVDSGSTDGSLDLAREHGALVVALDSSLRFTAARARNAGYRRLLQHRPESEFVQFVDGDCELAVGWLERGSGFLQSHSDVAAVSGRLRERDPGASIYNRLCAIEWGAPVGEADSCGGIVLMRAKAFDDGGGFNPDLIAGEEPELCVRLREKHWRLHRIDAEMATHDADMTRFVQWWRRSLRSGYAYAEAAFLHGLSPERPGVHESRSIRFWGAIFPVLAMALVWPTGGWSLLLLPLAYSLLVLKTYLSLRRTRMSAGDAALYAVACTVAKFPQYLGQARFHRSRLSGRGSDLIEHKLVRPARHG